MCTNPTSHRLAILISGRGSNMVAIHNALLACPDLGVEIGAVISDKAQAMGLEYAQENAIPFYNVNYKHAGSKQAAEEQILQLIVQSRATVIVLAGFMRILSPHFIAQAPVPIINIHPSLLPAFKGVDTHARALGAGVKLHGATVHHVNEELDGGEILAQAALTIMPDETPDHLAARVLQLEHILYIRTLVKDVLNCSQTQAFDRFIELQKQKIQFDYILST